MTGIQVGGDEDILQRTAEAKTQKTGRNQLQKELSEEKSRETQTKNKKSGFPAGSVVKDPSANARRHGFDPDPGGSPMTRSNKVWQHNY